VVVVNSLLRLSVDFCAYSKFILNVDGIVFVFNSSY
jgi:hypothetical protein